jgi:hypothetical protein
MDNGSNLPATVAMASSRQQIVESLGIDLWSPPARIDDRQLAVLDAVAQAPLPALPRCDEDHFAKCMRTLATLPRQQSDEVKGELQFNLYRKMLGHHPAQALSFLCETALIECDWFPTIKQCLAILGRWQRCDDAVQAKRLAEGLARRERQTRLDEARRALRNGTMDQAAIDALPERWRQIFETEALLWRHADGAYTLRHSPELDHESQANVTDITERLADRFPSHRGHGEAA